MRHAIPSPRDPAQPASVDGVGGKLHPLWPADRVKGETALPAGPLGSLVSQRGHGVSVHPLQGEGGRSKGEGGRGTETGEKRKPERTEPQPEVTRIERIRGVEEEARVRETGEGTRVRTQR